MRRPIGDIMADYGRLLAEVDSWYGRCQALFPREIRCGEGCSDCCRGLFDVTLLDAWYLRLGFVGLPSEVRLSVIDKAEGRLAGLRQRWPELAPPYILNYRPEGEWGVLMPEEDETPCVLLGDDGRCLLYRHRPMTCRLHGLPFVDLDGSILHDEWCTLNFPDRSPLDLVELRADFNGMFRREVELFRELESLVCKRNFKELDTFIPLALLVDLERFDWEGWVQGFHPAG